MSSCLGIYLRFEELFRLVATFAKGQELKTNFSLSPPFSLSLSHVLVSQAVEADQRALIDDMVTLQTECEACRVMMNFLPLPHLRLR